MSHSSKMCGLEPTFKKNGFTTWILIQRAVADPMEPDSDCQYFSNLYPITNGRYIFVFNKKKYVSKMKSFFFSFRTGIYGFSSLLRFIYFSLFSSGFMFVYLRFATRATIWSLMYEIRIMPTQRRLGR